MLVDPTTGKSAGDFSNYKCKDDLLKEGSGWKLFRPEIYTIKLMKQSLSSIDDVELNDCNAGEDGEEGEGEGEGGEGEGEGGENGESPNNNPTNG